MPRREGALVIYTRNEIEHEIHKIYTRFPILRSWEPCDSCDDDLTDDERDAAERLMDWQFLLGED